MDINTTLENGMVVNELYNWLDSLEKLKINCFKSKKPKSRQSYKAESWIWLQIKDIRGLRK